MHTRRMQTDNHHRQDTDAVLTRLGCIEAQVHAVQKMIDERRPPADIVTQLHAIVAATDSVAKNMLMDDIRGCIADAIRQRRGDEAITELMTALALAMQRN